ncbi:MAG: hypothetical protein E7666_06880 [Ruminococcaceae bacterium]|nr:hypothetical protein [Oscillospiraceae bacterium]
MTDSKKNADSAKLPPQKAPQPESLLDEYVSKKKPTSQASAAKKPEAPAPVTSDKQNTKKETDEKKTATQKEDGQPKKESRQVKAADSTGSNKKEIKKAVNRETKKEKEAEDVKTSTATKKPVQKESPAQKPQNDEKKKKDKNNAPAMPTDSESRPRSARPAHRVLPYVLLLLAIFIGVSLILNLICNPGNRLEKTPSEHLMGIVGYYICYALFGTFGPAVFVLPLLLLNLAFFWKRYIDRRIAISKIVASAIFLLVLGAVIHVFCLLNLPEAQRNLPLHVLRATGAKMTGGGMIGGSLGYLFFRWFNVAGSIIVGFALLAVSLFYFLGMTPQHVWDHLRARRAARPERTPSVSEQDAEEARNKAEMDEKIRRITGKKGAATDPQDRTDGAVSAVDPSPDKKAEERLAPMPIPKLDPNDGSRPFVPRDVGMKLNSENKTAAPASAPAHAPAAPAPAPKKAVPPADSKPIKQEPVAAPVQPTAKPVAPEKNRDTAVDPIFPRGNEQKTLRRVPREDQNFDLSNVFTEKRALPSTVQRKHAPVPPEVPPENTVRRSAATPTPSATAQAQKPKTAPAAQPVKVDPTATKAPSLSAIKPTPNQGGTAKPVFRQADKTKRDFGLSNEEFEQLEAKNAPLPKAGDAKPAGKDGAKKAEVKKPAHAPKPEAPKKYVFPPISYLHPGEPMTEENRAEIQASMEQLAATLGSFRVGVDEINYSCGPTVTRYEVVLKPGVRVRNVTNLADDIALALRSTGGVRIEAPIPGTNAVGIEVPNKTRSTIYLRDMIESEAFKKSESKLTAGLGADIAGDPLIFDIAKMPHLLIAGTTGSGKSVCINCIIMSLLYKVRPDEVRLVLIDPKKVEFSIYKNIPHLMAPVVTLPKDAAGALQASVEEMERRFEIFENVGVRDLKGYDKLRANDPDLENLPRIVIIIDELADLMMTAKNEVETAICRIAQKARAAGMHLIIGTQRPSADVVTGLIKANVPSSIAFAVKSQIDSRVILDHGGAEALTGRGDMLFVPIGAMRDTRVQGAFVDDKEVEKICEFIRATNGTAQYDERFTGKLKELAANCGNKGKNNDDVPASDGGDKGDDPKYADAVRVAIEENRISTSLLQRKLEVGYSRAAKLIDRMQSEGIVSPPDGSKPRSILITRDQYLERFFNEDGQGE